MSPATPPRSANQGFVRVLKTVTLSLALTAVLGASSIAWVPWWVKREIAAVGHEKLGRIVSVADVQFSPWNLTLGLDDLVIAATDGGTPQLRVRRMVVDAAIASLWQRAPVVDAITVEAPQLRLMRLSNGGYDIDDILARLTQPEPAAPEKPEPLEKTALFALHNLTLTEGAVDFNDQGRAHTLRDLHIAVPFLSTLPSQRDIKVSPHLAFVLNGSRFDTAAVGTPFAATRQTEATLNIAAWDVKPYLPYLPSTLPVRLQAAVLDVDMKVAFEQTPENRVRVSGTVAAHQLSATTPAGQPLLALEGLTVRLADVRPLEKIVKLEAIELQAPRGVLRREADGQLQWPRTVTDAKVNKPHQDSKTPESIATSASRISATTPFDTKTASGTWQVELQRFSLTDGAFSWTDTSLQPQAKLGLSHVNLQATDLAWPMKAPAPFQGAASLDGAETATGQLTVSGTASLQAAHVTATVANLPLAVASSYTNTYLRPGLQGLLNAQLGLDWQAQGNELRLFVPKLNLNALALVEGDISAKTAKSNPSAHVLASIQSLEITSTTIALPQQTVSIGGVTVKAPKTRIERGADQHWMFERWLKAATPSKSTVTPPAPPWQIAIADINIEGGALHFTDKAAAQPVEFDLTALQLNLKNFSPTSGKALPLSLSANIGAGPLAPGALAVRGTLALAPLAVQATVDAKRLPVHSLMPYAAKLLNLDVVRADTSYQGQVQFRQTPAGPQVALSGDVNVDDFRANTLLALTPQASPATTSIASEAHTSTTNTVSNELLSWKALAVRGLAVKLAPNTATQVDVKETVLSDFFARLILSEKGRLNLQDLSHKEPKETKEAQATDAPVAAVAPATKAAIVHVGPISLVNGKVFFSDHFVNPNYSADVTELTGRLSAFSTDASVQTGDMQLADLVLRGRAEGSASLDIVGKLNPLAAPLALDIQGKVRDLELPPLSTYAIKYAGHGIERGKLSLDVNYLIKPDGQLSATNKLVLNQLIFSDAVKGATASLPVKLAAALLADRNGVIDLDLPISGSLNDPQFRIGPVIFKIIMNVIGKALTAPFSLLSSVFSGSAGDASVVTFPPGSARLTPEAQQSLDKVATALTDRPALHLTVTGSVNIEAERDAFQREHLNALLLAQKGPGATAITEAEYPALLKEHYKRTDMPKPRNLVGLTKDIPTSEMLNLLLANLPATTSEAMRQLATQRGVAVRDYLVGKALPMERLVLGAAKVETAEDKGGPRAELSLGMP